MSHIIASRHGEVEYNRESIFYFPSGLPGFEDQHEFIFLSKPNTEPVVFMQSTSDADLCFILLPVLVADPDYQLEMSIDDARELHLATGRQPRIGDDVLCAVLVCAGENVTPTVNLMAPIVVNLKDRIGIQLISSGSAYSHRAPLLREDRVSCS